MARIPEETINRIRAAADILDVVSDYVQLKRRGVNWFGLCPFHHEKTPSFSINQRLQIFHCFGCGRGGNAFSFIMEIEKVDFVDAVRRLGEKYGISVEFTGTDPRHKATVQQVMDLCELAASYYRKNLLGETGARVREYLKERGLSPETQEQFRLGYAQDRWDGLLKAVSGKKFSREALNQSGLFAAGERGPYDRFRGRVIFPLANVTGRVVAFAGRVFDGDETAKYINSPETPVYHKSEILYGLSLTRSAIRDQEEALIVEGYLDLIQLYQAGIANLVAVSGTALTDRHARELGKLVTRVFLAYDADEAGIQAAIRGGYTLLRNGLTPLVVGLPAGLDPDDWVRKEGPEPLRQATEKAVPLLEFHLKHFRGDLSQPGDMRRFLDETLQELVQVQDPLVRELQLKQVAELSGIDERRLYEALNRLPARRFRAAKEEEAGAEKAIPIEPTRSHKAQMTLIRLSFLDDERVLNLLADQAGEELFSHPLLGEIWRALSRDLEAGAIPEAQGVMDRLADTDEVNSQGGEAAAVQTLSRILMSQVETADPLILAIDCLTVLQREVLQRQIDGRRRELRRAEQTGEQLPEELLAEVTALQHRLADLGKRFKKYRDG